MLNYFLIIDPYLKTPSKNGIHSIQVLHSIVLKDTQEISDLQVFYPSISKVSLFHFLQKRKVSNLLGVISLGSYAHIYENREWVTQLAKDLKAEIFTKRIPFLGICFSHQLCAHIYGETVDYADKTQTGFDEFREIEIVHPKLQKLLPNSNKFIAKVRYKQEVKTLNSFDLEVSALSSSCKIEGLVHKKFPIFTFQSHIEEYHPTGLGWEIIQNFMKNAQTQSFE